MLESSLTVGLPHPYLCCSHNSIVALEELLQRRGAITLCSSHRCARLQHHLFAETTACRLGCSDDVLAVLLGIRRSSVFHNASLQDCKFLARLRRSVLSSRQGSCSGSQLVRWNRKVDGIRMRSWTSSSTYDNGRRLSCLHFENNVAQFRPGQLPTSHSFKEGALEQPDQSLKLAAPPRRPAQVELPVDPFVC